MKTVDRPDGRFLVYWEGQQWREVDVTPFAYVYKPGSVGSVVAKPDEHIAALEAENARLMAEMKKIQEHCKKQHVSVNYLRKVVGEALADASGMTGQEIFPKSQNTNADVGIHNRILDALNDYAELLESGIEAHTVPGTDQAVPCEQEILDDLRAKWKEAQAIMRQLEASA